MSNGAISFSNHYLLRHLSPQPKEYALHHTHFYDMNAGCNNGDIHDPGRITIVEHEKNLFATHFPIPRSIGSCWVL